MADDNVRYDTKNTILAFSGQKSRWLTLDRDSEALRHDSWNPTSHPWTFAADPVARNQLDHSDNFDERDVLYLFLVSIYKVPAGIIA